MPPTSPNITDDEYYSRALQAEWGAHSPQPQHQRPPTLGPSASDTARTSAHGLLSPMRLAASLRKLGGGDRTPASPSFAVTQAYSTLAPPAPNPQRSTPPSDEEFARFLQAEEDAAFRAYGRQPVSPVAGPSSPAAMRSPAPKLVPPQPEIHPPPGFGRKGKAPMKSSHPDLPPAYGTGTSSHYRGVAPMMHLSTVSLLRCSAHIRTTTRWSRECCRSSSNKNCLKIAAA